MNSPAFNIVTVVEDILAPHLTPPSRFDAVLEHGRDAYLNSPTGKARTALKKADRLSRVLRCKLRDLGTALSRGDGSEAARVALFDAVLDLRIACGDVEALVRLVEADQ